MSITREVVFSDEDKNYRTIVSGKTIEIYVNSVFCGSVDVNDADLLISLLRESISEIVGAEE